MAHSFRRSYGVSLISEGEKAHILKALQKIIPGALALNPATKEEDKSGTDFFLRCTDDKRIAIDLKVRPRFKDIVIELQRTTPNGIRPGWTVDPSKTSEVIVFYFRETGWVYAFDAAHLRQTAIEWQEEWQDSYRFVEVDSCSENKAAEWITSCLFVPPSDLISFMHATPPSTPPVLPLNASVKLLSTLFSPVPALSPVRDLAPGEFIAVFGNTPSNPDRRND